MKKVGKLFKLFYSNKKMNKQEVLFVPVPKGKLKVGRRKKEKERNSRFKVKGFRTRKPINSNETEKNSKTPKRYRTAGMKI